MLFVTKSVITVLLLHRPEFIKGVTINMLRSSLFIAVVLFLGSAIAAEAQDVAQRTLELTASLDKTKHKKKEKKGFSFETYVDVKNTPAVRSDPSQYSGLYKADGYVLDLRVGRNGEAQGTGRDQMLNNGREGRFTLRNARVTGALLTATKEYSDGETRKFEALFVDRTTVQGKNPDAIDTTAKAFGLGWVEGGSAVVSDVAWSQWSHRVFLERVK